jgi:membrane-bound metal-dependent hydrolase YbcI (DUF457 family)
MYPQTHFLFPFFLAEILVSFGYLNHWQALIAGLVGMLIDLDHPIEYALIKKKFSWREAWNNSVVTHKVEGRTFIHHLYGFLLFTTLCLILVFFYWKISLIIFLGYHSHILLDYLHLHFLEKKLKFKEFGFIFRIPRYEAVINLLLIIGIVLLIVL